jgi:phosphatidylinositol glycan class A protein
MTICLITDFFYPSPGGVESHVHHLAATLAKTRRVIVVTHSHISNEKDAKSLGRRTGIRYLQNGIKVYYLPYLIMFQGATFPTIYASWPLLRQIFLREQVSLLHGHQTFSTLAYEACFLIRLAFPTVPIVFTDHSLYGFNSVSSILMNKILKFSCSVIDQFITVSHVGRENTVLRGKFHPKDVSVIPNAIISQQFTPPSHAKENNSKTTIVVVSRMTQRKGISLLISILPDILKKYPQLNFIIAGDGPKRIELESCLKTHFLQDKVTLLGSIRHDQVHQVLRQGDIFLNCSLTEAFGIGMIEAASCGLLVVSTNVGGVPEILPEEFILLSEPNHHPFIAAIEEAISIHNSNRRPSPEEMHRQIKGYYSWDSICKRTLAVYDVAHSQRKNEALLDTLKAFRSSGSFAGLLFCVVFGFGWVWIQMLSWLDLLLWDGNVELAAPWEFIH